jgi:hypothetical protein
MTRLAVGRTVFLVLVVTASTVPSFAVEDHAAILEKARNPSPDLDAARVGRNLQIDLGPAVLELVEGTVVPMKPVAGRVVEVAFRGQGRFKLEVADAIERSQLEQFTGQPELDVAFDQVVLVLADATIVERVFAGAAQPLADEPATTDWIREWTEGPGRRGFDVSTSAFRAAIGDPAYEGFALAWFRSEQLGDFFYVLDPLEQEQARLGQFVALDLDVVERHRIDRYIQRARRSGRHTRTRVDDLGDWDTWVSMSLQGSDGSTVQGATSLEPSHYELEVTLDDDMSLTGRARITATATHDASKMATLQLFLDLAVRAVRDGQGQDLFWFHSGGGVQVVLDPAPALDAEVVIEVEYDGEVVRELEGGGFRLGDTSGWYPSTGTIDRATYDVTFRWPKKYELLASGVRVDGGQEGRTRWLKKRMPVPALAFTFEVGNFEVLERQVGHVAMTVGVTRNAGALAKGVKDELLDTLSEALTYFESTYGPYPLDELTVVTISRGFSQGYLSFLSLAHVLFWGQGPVDVEDRTETIAHELAHQWWGNLMGWASYRDQWLSESLADYSAVSFTAQRGEKKRPIYLAGHARDWQSSVSRRTSEGRTYESMGPVVLGNRLISSRSRWAYVAVVYDKGSVVLRNLARALGEQRFDAMLGALVQAVGNRVIETGTFIKSLERMSGVDLGGFADQFIYGTGIPEIFYSYEFQRTEDGRWSIEGEAEQVGAANYSYRLIRTASGAWDVARRRETGLDVAASTLVVPFQIVLSGSDPGEPEKKRDRWKPRTGIGLGGQLVLQGSSSRFNIPIDREPVDFYFDQNGEVLARFYCESRQPKRMLRFQGERQSGQGDHEAAMQTFQAALRAPLAPESRRGELSRKQLQERTEIEDAMIQYRLATLYLDMDRGEEALEAYQKARKLLGPLNRPNYERTDLLLKARMDVRNGEYKAAYGALSNKLSLRIKRTGEGTVGDAMRRRKFGRGWRAPGDAYALLAVAAANTGHPDIAALALEEAESRRADMTLLRTVLEAGDVRNAYR